MHHPYATVSNPRCFQASEGSWVLTTWNQWQTMLKDAVHWPTISREQITQDASFTQNVKSSTTIQSRFQSQTIQGEELINNILQMFELSLKYDNNWWLWFQQNSNLGGTRFLPAWKVFSSTKRVPGQAGQKGSPCDNFRWNKDKVDPELQQI